MIASFFNSSNTWFGYLSNFFFAAAGVITVAKVAARFFTKKSDAKVESFEKELASTKADMDEKFEQLLSQHRTNGGSSSKDQWNRIQNLAESVDSKLDFLHREIDEIRQDFAEHKGFHKGLSAQED